MDVKFLFINANLNPEGNPHLFKTKISNKVFDKYEVLNSFNKLASKQYYDGEIDIKRVKLMIQG